MTTTQTPVEALMALEREKFEAHAVKNWCHKEDLKRGRLTGYIEPELNQAWRGWSARALAAIPAQAATAVAITADEIKLFAHTIEQFEDCNETDTPYETLMKWANRGWLECEHFISTAEGNRVLEGISPPLFAASEPPACQACGAEATRDVPSEATELPGPYCDECGPGGKPPLSQQAGGVPAVFVLVPAEIVDRFPEINPSNYDHDDACALNAWGVELVLAASPSPSAVQPLSEAQIEECWEKRWGRGTYSTVGRRLFFARAIEAAHGIVTKESA